MVAGDTLELVPNATYILPAGTRGLAGLPSGTDAAHTRVNGNGATLVGGLVGLELGDQHYIDIYDLNVKDQSAVGMQVTLCSHLYFENCRFEIDSVQLGYFDATKLFNLSESRFYRCTAIRGPNAVSNTVSLDGFELWSLYESSANVVFEECDAIGFRSPGDVDGHGFEIYRNDDGFFYTGVQYINCYARNCVRGFSVESGGVTGISHAAEAIGCYCEEIYQCAYAVDGEATLQVSDALGSVTTCGDVQFI